ncbi:MAG TPA: hypothetical protein V6D19_21100 [Stenomitos sp.]
MSILSVLLGVQLRSQTLAEIPAQTRLNPLLGGINVQPQTATLLFGKKGAEFPDYKEARIRYPQVVGAPSSTLLQKVQGVIGLKQVLGQSLVELRQEFRENHWLSNIDYAITYNRYPALSLTYFVSGVGAYPDGYEKHVSVDLRTGKRLQVEDFLQAAAIAPLTQEIDRMLQQEIQKTMTEVLQQEPDFGTDLFMHRRFERQNLSDFSITKEGITFYYNFDFPHVVKAAEPKHDFLIRYRWLAPYLRPEGALGQYASAQP